MPPRASGTRKNLLLTLWLLLPFAVLAGIVAIIFASYGKQKMDARPVGQGAGETGGANALGELLAGNDPIETERIARNLREGRVIDPLDWPAGIMLFRTVEAPEVQTISVVAWRGRGADEFEFVQTQEIDREFARRNGFDPSSPEHAGGGSIARRDILAVIGSGAPGAGFYVASSGSVMITPAGLVAEGGGSVRPIRFELVPGEHAREGEPIEMLLRVEFSSATPLTAVQMPE